MGNKIPRKFNCITAEMLIDTNTDIKGDIIRIYKDLNGYLAINARTNESARMFASMIRNENCCRIVSII